MTYLSSGTKGLIVLKYTNEIVNLVSMGDNCIPYLVELSNEKDLLVSSSRVVDFWRFGYTGELLIKNEDILVSNFNDMLDVCDRYI